MHRSSSRTSSCRRVSWKDEDIVDMPMYNVPDGMDGDITCGVAGIVRSASFRNSFKRGKKEPHWIYSKFHLCFSLSLMYILAP